MAGEGRTLESAIQFFCRSYEIRNPSSLKAAWEPTLRSCGRSGIRALIDLALSGHTYGHPRLGDVVSRAESLFCPPVDSVVIWMDVLAEARKSGPPSDSLHPAVSLALSYVGVDRLRSATADAVGFLKAEVDRAVASYNAKPFTERAVLEGKVSESQIARWPRAEVYGA